MKIRPDDISFLSTLPNYINLTFDNGSPTGTINVSGNIPDLAVQDFSVTIPTSNLNTRFDVYGVNQNTGTKQLFSNTSFPVIYQNAGGEVANVVTEYSPSSIKVTIELFNGTGAPIALVAQSIVVSIIEYQIPY